MDVCLCAFTSLGKLPNNKWIYGFFCCCRKWICFKTHSNLRCQAFIYSSYTFRFYIYYLILYFPKTKHSCYETAGVGRCFSFLGFCWQVRVVCFREALVLVLQAHDLENQHDHHRVFSRNFANVQSIGFALSQGTVNPASQRVERGPKVLKGSIVK